MEVLFPVSASYDAIQSLDEKEVGFLGEKVSTLLLSTAST